MPVQLAEGTVKRAAITNSKYKWGDWITPGEFAFSRKTEANPDGDYKCTTGGFIAALKKACKKLGFTSVVTKVTEEGFQVKFAPKVVPAAPASDALAAAMTGEAQPA